MRRDWLCATSNKQTDRKLEVSKHQLVSLCRGYVQQAVLDIDCLAESKLSGNGWLSWNNPTGKSSDRRLPSTTSSSKGNPHRMRELPPVGWCGSTSSKPGAKPPSNLSAPEVTSPHIVEIWEGARERDPRLGREFQTGPDFRKEARNRASSW